MFSWFCSRVRPIPNLNYSLVIYVGNFGSKDFRQIFSLTIDVNLSNLFLLDAVKSWFESFLISSLGWWVCSESCGMNLRCYAITLRKHCIFCPHLGKGMSLIAFTFSGSGEIFYTDIFCPKNINLVSRKTHFFLFSFSSVRRYAQCVFLFGLGSILI